MAEHQPQTLTVILPWPAAELSPNKRDRWRKIEAVPVARNSAYILALEQPEEIDHGPLILILQFWAPDGRRYDLDGLISRCKPYLDGICTAKRIDDYQIAEIRAIRHEGIMPGGRVTITIMEAKGE